MQKTEKAFNFQGNNNRPDLKYPAFLKKIKFRYSEKATKIWPIFRLEFDTSK